VQDYSEIKKIIESSFQPYHCGVEIMLASETFMNELRFRVSNVDHTLNYEDTADLKVVRESLNQLIPIWRREAENRGFKLDPL
jgi:hypothetical protein